MIECDICNKDFKNQRSMKNHRRWHDDIFRLKVIEKMSIHKKNLYKNKENHPNWNHIENNPTVGSFHRFIKKRKIKPKQCEICNKEKSLELSFNHKLGNYTRNIGDYKWICRKCHMHNDGRAITNKHNKSFEELKEVLEN